MRSLHSGRIGKVNAIDGTATYEGWPDLVSTVDQILNTRATQGVVVHTTDPSKADNPHDHFDHRMAGLIVEELRKKHGMDARYYTGYALASRAPNRTNQQQREKTAIFIAYDAEMMRVDKNWSAFREHPTFYSQCMMRTYARSPRQR
jgi:LmbE family N-acetylglucosaminyl deacetylase